MRLTNKDIEKRLPEMVMGYLPNVKYFVLKEKGMANTHSRTFEPEYIGCPLETLAMAVVKGR